MSRRGIGRGFGSDDNEGHARSLTDANAVVRSLDRRTNRVWRQWDRRRGKLFLGLIMNLPPDEEVPQEYELRILPKRRVVRLSGTNRLDEDSEIEAVGRFCRAIGLVLNHEYPARLSGQSFSLYQWDIEKQKQKQGEEPSVISRWMESTYQLRNNLVIPLLATLVAVGLIETARPLMLVLGILRSMNRRPSSEERPKH